MTNQIETIMALADEYAAQNKRSGEGRLTHAARQALEAALKPGEPVAWRYVDSRGHFRYRGFVAGFDKEHPILKPVPLYTAAAPAQTPCRCKDRPASECPGEWEPGCDLGSNEKHAVPLQCEPQPAVTEDGFCEWVCPTPSEYFMQCCDCGLIHEAQFRVTKYKPRPSEEFEVLDDLDTQCQFRMRRRDDLSTAQTPPRLTPGEPAVEELVIDRQTEWVTGAELAAQQEAMPEQFAAPPRREPLTTERYTELAHRIASKYAHRSDPKHIAYTFLPHTLEQFVRSLEAAHGIGGKE